MYLQDGVAIAETRDEINANLNALTKLLKAQETGKELAQDLRKRLHVIKRDVGIHPNDHKRWLPEHLLALGAHIRKLVNCDDPVIGPVLGEFFSHTPVLNDWFMMRLEQIREENPVYPPANGKIQRR